MKEEQILFPYVLRMEQSVIASEIAPPAMFGAVMNPGEPPVKSRARRRGGWLQIEGLVQMKYLMLARQLPTVYPAGFFLFTAFLVMSLLFRKAFCSCSTSSAT